MIMKINDDNNDNDDGGINCNDNVTILIIA